MKLGENPTQWINLQLTMTTKEEIIKFLQENYTNNDEPALTVEAGEKTQTWTLAGLFVRRWLNDMYDAPGWGLTNVRDVYIYLCVNKESVVEHGLIEKEGYNNSGFPLWSDYDFDTWYKQV